MPAIDPITAIANLVNTVISVSSKETTDCGKKCRAKCQGETGWLFSGREKCKKACMSDCADQLSPQEQQAILLKQQKAEDFSRNIAIIIVITFALIIILILYFILKKK